MSGSPSEEFGRELIDSQSRLRSFVVALVPDRDAAQEIVQNTNLVLWRKSGEFTAGTNFVAWSFAVARNEVLLYYRRCERDRLVFDAPLVEELADDAQSHAEGASELEVWLDECLSLRSAEERVLLNERYVLGGSVAAMAKQRGCSANSISLALFRLRHKLSDCIDRKKDRGGVE